MGHESDVWIIEPHPCRCGRVELKPCGTELEVIRLTSPADAVHAVGDSLEPPVLEEAGEGAWRDAGLDGLAARYEAPLLLRYGEKPLCRSWHAAKYAVIGLLRSTPRCERQRAGAGCVTDGASTASGGASSASSRSTSRSTACISGHRSAIWSRSAT